MVVPISKMWNLGIFNLSATPKCSTLQMTFQHNITLVVIADSEASAASNSQNTSMYPFQKYIGPMYPCRRTNPVSHLWKRKLICLPLNGKGYFCRFLGGHPSNCLWKSQVDSREWWRWSLTLKTWCWFGFVNWTPIEIAKKINKRMIVKLIGFYNHSSKFWPWLHLFLQSLGMSIVMSFHKFWGIEEIYLMAGPKIFLEPRLESTGFFPEMEGFSNCSSLGC